MVGQVADVLFDITTQENKPHHSYAHIRLAHLGRERFLDFYVHAGELYEFMLALQQTHHLLNTLDNKQEKV